MKIKFWKYDFQDARRVAMLFEAMGFKGATIIGSLSRKGHSNNDIDIFLPNDEYGKSYHDIIVNTLSCGEPIITDWGSMYFKNTPFGTLDIFFKGQTDEFDY